MGLSIIPENPNRVRKVLKKKRFLIGGLIIVLAIGYLAYTGFESSATYYYTVTELTVQKSSVNGMNVRVNGQVVDGSVEQDIKERILRFIIVDVEGAVSLPVVYQGIVPDTFRVESDVVIEGCLNSAGVFQASSILTKCPSKYEPKN